MGESWYTALEYFLWLDKKNVGLVFILYVYDYIAGILYIENDNDKPHTLH